MHSELLLLIPDHLSLYQLSVAFSSFTSWSFWSHNLHAYRWLGLIGQIRPKKLISSIKAEFFTNDEFEVPTFKDAARHFLDKSLYSVGLCTQFLLTPASSVKLSTEGDGEKKGRRSKVMLFHKACIWIHSFRFH